MLTSRHIQETLDALLGVKPVPPPPAPPMVRQVFKGASTHASGISVLASLSYKSLSGNFKDRDVMIRRAVRNKGDWYLDVLALDIKAPRVVKVADISRVVDTGTGRVYADPFAFCQQKLGIAVDSRASSAPAGDFPKVIAKVGDEMAMLMYVVAADGVRRPVERAFVHDYVRARTPEFRYADAELEAYLISLAPDAESFALALEHAVSKDKSVIPTLIETMLLIITMDDDVHPRERALLDKLVALLEREGFAFKLPI
ncbi:MAG: hypothetical protein PHX68_01895 [Alphaproteobacteria bacterium]|nr:hypothetical protein [Alphaproteobacteria bacterium]